MVKNGSRGPVKVSCSSARENYILDEQPKSWKEDYIYILKVRTIGFDGGFDVDLQKDRGAKDQGLRD